MIIIYIHSFVWFCKYDVYSVKHKLKSAAVLARKNVALKPVKWLVFKGLLPGGKFPFLSSFFSDSMQNEMQL